MPNVTQDELAAALTELDRRYREEPERFTSESRNLLKEKPQSYGEACAPYLLAIIEEQKPPRIKPPPCVFIGSNWP